MVTVFHGEKLENHRIMPRNKMAVFVLILLMMHWQFCVSCPDTGAKHSLFFMSIDSFDTYTVDASTSCICDNQHCTLRCNDSSINCLDSNKMYWVQSDTVVHGVIGNNSLREMYNVLKDDYLGKEYIVAVYIDVSGQSFLGVGNPSDAPVNVNITLPQVNTFSLVGCENTTIDLNLQAYEARTLQFNCDISGTHIIASDDIIVYAATFSSVSPESSSLQFMIEQVIPVTDWGTFYTVIPYGENVYGDVISVITSAPNTFVHIQGYDYVTVPEEYGSIRRRIEGRKPVTVRSSQPVSVVQFSMNAAGKQAMTLNIPVTFDTDTKALLPDPSLLYSYLHYSAGDQADEDSCPLTPFFASRRIPEPDQGMFGCSVYGENGVHFGGTFCDFLQSIPKSNERYWPQMIPGDGEDNDNDGSIDEDDCYSGFVDSTDPAAAALLDVQDCKKEVSDGSVKEIFIIPYIPETGSLLSLTTEVQCRINTTLLQSLSFQAPPSPNWRNPTENPANVFQFTDLGTTGPLIIKSTATNKLHLSCHYVCDSVNCSNSFFVPSLSLISSKYNAQIPPCSNSSLTCQKQCTISNVFKNTSYRYVNNHSADMYSFPDTFTLRSLEFIESGNYIEGNLPFAAMCFTREETNFLVHYLLSSDSAGVSYNLIRTGLAVDEKLFIWATDSNTLLHLNESDESSNGTSAYTLILNAGDHAVIDLAADKDDTYYNITSNKPVQVLAHFKTNSTIEFSGFRSNIPFNPDGYNIVHVPSASSVLLPPDGSLVSRTIAGVPFYSTSDSGWPHHSSFLDRRVKPVRHVQTPGDGIDNDKDGLVDEDFCGFLIQDVPSEGSTLHDVDLDGSYNEDCRGCPGGSELDAHLVCAPCGIGTFREDASKIDRCKPCGENMTTFDIGSRSQCVPLCEEGMELDNETMRCLECPIGYYKNVSANDSSASIQERFWCKQCGPHLTTYDFGTKDPSGCIGHCGEGQKLDDTGTCLPCALGFYKNVSSTDLTASVALRWNCTACDGNRTTESRGTVQETECKDLCLEGMELNNVSMSCEPCSVGYYKEVQANDSSSDVRERFWCLECPADKTTQDVGSTDSAKCIDHCIEGEEFSGTGCQPCSIGFYKDVSSTNISAPVEKRWNCTACGQNETTMYTGTIQRSDCLGHCGEGMFLNGTRCQSCPVGFYKSTSSEDSNAPAQLRWNCTACEPGETTYSIGSRQCIAHCGIGQQLNEGVCTPCEIGFYKNTSSEDELLPETKRWNCSQCPNGLTTNSTGAQTCVVHCPVGMEYLPTDATCQLCRIGFYKDVSGSHVDCLQCPVNYTTRSEGTVSPQGCKLANCVCPCDKVHEVKNYTSEELSKLIEELKKELTVNKAVLSATIRKKISVMDYRPSAKSIGSVGAVLITLIFVLLIAFDIPILKEHLTKLFKGPRNPL